MPQAPEEIAKELTIAFLQSNKGQIGERRAEDRNHVIADKTGAQIGELYLAILAKLKSVP
jgi:hypothetical protein